MTNDVAAALLNRAANGNEMLQILDTLSDGFDANEPAATVGEPTADPIQF